MKQKKEKKEADLKLIITDLMKIKEDTEAKMKELESQVTEA